MEEDERPKIDLKQHALSPVSRKYLLRIILYVMLLSGLSYFMYYVYNREPEQKKVQSPDGIKEIKGITISDSI